MKLRRRFSKSFVRLIISLPHWSFIFDCFYKKGNDSDHLQALCMLPSTQNDYASEAVSPRYSESAMDHGIVIHFVYQDEAIVNLTILTDVKQDDIMVLSDSSDVPVASESDVPKDIPQLFLVENDNQDSAEATLLDDCIPAVSEYWMIIFLLLVLA